MASAEHGDVDVLHEAHADLLHGLDGGVPHHEGALDVVPVVVELPVQGGLQLQLPLGEEKVLPDGGGGLPALPGGGELDLPDGHVDTGLLSVHALHDGPDVVLHPAGLARLQAWLEGDGGGGVGGEPQLEGERVLAQLAQQPVLQQSGALCVRGLNRSFPCAEAALTLCHKDTERQEMPLLGGFGCHKLCFYGIRAGGAVS